jgi:hypothetical protein
LYQVIERKDICPFFSLEVEGSGVNAKYKAQ